MINRFRAHFFSYRCLAPAAALLLVLAYFSPVLFLPPHTIPGILPDAWQTTWNVWWIRQWESGSYPSLYFCPLLYYPFGTSLYVHTLYEALFLPLVVVFRDLSPEQIVSLSCVTVFLLNVFSLRLYFAELIPKESPKHIIGPGSGWIFSWFLSLLLAFHPYFAAHLWGAHLGCMLIFPFALLLTALMRAGRRSLSPQFLVFSAVIFGGSAYIDFYYIYFAALFLPCLLLALALLRVIDGRRVMRAGVFFALISGAICAPKLAFVSQAMHSGEYQRNRPPSIYTAGLSTLVLPGKAQFVFRFLPAALTGLQVKKHLAESGNYLGLGLLAFLALGFAAKTEKRTAAGFCIAALMPLTLSFGPAFHGGEDAFAANQLFNLCYRIFPFFPSVPSRFTIISELYLFSAAASLSGVLAQGSESAPLPRRLGIFLCAVALLEFFPSQLLTSTRTDDELLTRLAGNASVRAVFDPDADATRAMTRQMYHHKPIIGGYISRYPVRAMRIWRNNRLVLAALRMIPEQQPLEILRASWKALHADRALLNADGTFARSLLGSGLFKIEDRDRQYILLAPTEAQGPQDE